MESHGVHYNMSVEELKRDVSEFIDDPNLTVQELCLRWCELCSEQFFENQENVCDDVLLVTNVDGIIIKEWLASREEEQF